MHVLVITSKLEGLDDTTYRQQAEQIAPAFDHVPGLIRKTWLAEEATNSYGGVYLVEHSVQSFGTIEAASLITHGWLLEPALAGRGWL